MKKVWWMFWFGLGLIVFFFVLYILVKLYSPDIILPVMSFALILFFGVLEFYTKRLHGHEVQNKTLQSQLDDLELIFQDSEDNKNLESCLDVWIDEVFEPLANGYDNNITLDPETREILTMLFLQPEFSHERLAVEFDTTPEIFRKKKFAPLIKQFDFKGSKPEFVFWLYRRVIFYELSKAKHNTQKLDT